jgi:transcriptional regulator with XRE-family HTH domain
MPRAKPADTSLGNAVRRARVSAGLSQAQLAERTDVAIETISRTERGVLAPSVAVLVRIADALEVGLDELVRGRRSHGPTKAARTQSVEVRRITSLLHGLDNEALDSVHRGLQAFLRLRRPGGSRSKPAR